ncbi:U5 snRNP protein DIM1 family [Clonorchis sinensis]|uniref:Thioredoxin-like protein 4A n=3 Tax=Opisthorchiidae TaxID=6196 RepID=G7YQE2_CLOSI|nr:U5 snRNP protein DIM1 family [Clonorchis sinensis]
MEICMNETSEIANLVPIAEQSHNMTSRSVRTLTFTWCLIIRRVKLCPELAGIFLRDLSSVTVRSDIECLAMSYMLSHLTNGWQVDQAILSEEDRVVVIRFGHDWDPSCMVMDETLFKIAEKVKNFAVIYLVDITKVPDFNKMYELYDPCTVMFFYRNKHIMIDLGTGNNNKINWPIEDGQEMLDIIETVFRGARKGRGLVVSPKDYSTKYRY